MANLNYNKVTLGGRFSADPELKNTPSGKMVTSFTIAVGRRYKNEGEADADFPFCVAWGKTAEFICRYFKKSSSILIEGELRTRSWTDGSGNKRYATEVIVSEAHFVDSKSDAKTSASAASDKQPTYESTSAPAPNFEAIEGDEDLPF